MVDVAACTACLGPIVWGKTDKAKRMPLDADPSATGNALLLPSGRVVVLGGPDAAALVDAGLELRWPHHATCTKWKKPPAT